MRSIPVIAAFVLGCGSGTSGPGATSASAASSAAPVVSTQPPASAPAVPTSSASAPPTAPSASPKLGNCYSEAESQRYGSVTDAEPPFEACARQLKVHCDAKNGGRGGLYGLKLLVEDTKKARKTQPDACCYASCD